MIKRILFIILLFCTITFSDSASIGSVTIDGKIYNPINIYDKV